MRTGNATRKDFGPKAAEAIDWIKPWDKVFDADAGVYGRWFAGAECNTCFNAVDRHVEGGRARPARADPRQRHHRHGHEIHLCRTEGRGGGAGRPCSRDQGVEKGDRVIIYMPMVPEAVFAMLACARLGAIHSVVFGGFAARRTRHPHRRCDPQTDRRRFLRPRTRPHCSPTSRCSTERSTSPATRSNAASSCSARSSPAISSPAAT